MSPNNQNNKAPLGPQRADYSHGYRRTSQPVNQRNVVNEAAQAAHRLSGQTPVNTPSSNQEAVVIPVHNRSSTDKQPQMPPPEPADQTMRPPQAQYYQQPTVATQPAPQQDFSLPTDLPEPAKHSRKDSFASTKPKKRFNVGFNLPKLPSLKAVGAVGAAVFVLGAGLYTYSYLNSSGQELASVQGASDTKEIQDEEGGLLLGARPHEGGNVPSVEYYRTSPSYPRVIRVPKIELETRVLPLSISPTGALKSPSTIFDAAWYKDSAKPGEDGAMVINAHTAGEYNKGIFYNLETLKKGDLIEIEDGAGNTYVYTVKDTKIFEADEVDMSSVMRPFLPDKKGLNLINSAGRAVSADSYEKRVVVYSVID